MNTIWCVIIMGASRSNQKLFSSYSAAKECYDFEVSLGDIFTSGTRIELWSMEEFEERFYLEKCLEQHIKD